MIPSSSNLKPHNVPVILLGSGITALATMRCLGKAGIKAMCASPSKTCESFSRWFSPIPGRGSVLKDGDNLDEYLAQLPLDKAVVIACNDHWIMKAGQISSDLASRFSVCQSKPEVHEQFIDKAKCAELLSRHDIPRPATYPINTEEDIPNISEDELLHYFIKPRNSLHFSEKFGVKGIWVKSRADCADKIRDLRDQGFEIVLQEYIGGPASNYFYVEGMIDRNGKVCATFARQRLRMVPTDFGNSSLMVSVDPKEVKGAVESIHRLLGSVGYRGIYSAEFKLDPKDNLFKIMEVNTRPWWYIECPLLCGVNVAELAYMDALGQDVSCASANYRIGLKLINFLADFSLWRTQFRAGQVGFFDWAGDWLQAYSTVGRLSDPLPGAMWVVRRILAYGVSTVSHLFHER